MSESAEGVKIIDIRTKSEVQGGIASDFSELSRQIKQYAPRQDEIREQSRKGVPFWKRISVGGRKSG